MKVDILVQNLLNLFLIAAVLQVSAMAIFSMKLLKDVLGNRPMDTVRDLVILAVAFFLCYKSKDLTVFRRTGIAITPIIDTIIAALVVTRIANVEEGLLSKIRL